MSNGILEQMQEARHACSALAFLVREENHGLLTQKVASVEERLQLKKSLSLRLERLVQDIKNQRGAWAGDARAVMVARQLAREIEAFKEIATANLQQLKAAHQLRAEVVAMIKDTIEAAQMPVGYGRDGSAMRTELNVMRKEI